MSLKLTKTQALSGSNLWKLDQLRIHHQLWAQCAEKWLLQTIKIQITIQFKVAITRNIIASMTWFQLQLWILAARKLFISMDNLRRLNILVLFTKWEASTRIRIFNLKQMFILLQRKALQKFSSNSLIKKKTLEMMLMRISSKD
jgi:hypothetical protein